jgi:single-stranded DNA-binding protein
MTDTNYIGGIVKILEEPKQKIVSTNILVVTFRAQLPQIRKTKVVTLTFWGDLANDVMNYYKMNDYILIEGYLSFYQKRTKNLSFKREKKVHINILRVYPFLLK